MAELTINQVIKIILGVLVFVAVVAGVYLFFKNQVIGFLDNFVSNETSKLFFSLI